MKKKKSEILDFYEWYSERNAITRVQVLNELEKRAGIHVNEYPVQKKIYTEEQLIEKIADFVHEVSDSNSSGYYSSKGYQLLLKDIKGWLK